MLEYDPKGSKKAELPDLGQFGEGGRNGRQVHSAVEVFNAQALQALEAGDGPECAAADIEPVAAAEDSEGLQALEEQPTHDAEGDHVEVVLVHQVDKLPIL